MLLVLVICTNAVNAELIAYWPFDEGNGTETADITGNGNDGTFNGDVAWVAGYKDSAVHFDTASERIVVGPIDPTAGTDAMTLAAWINWEGLDHSITQQGIIGKRLGKVEASCIRLRPFGRDITGRRQFDLAVNTAKPTHHIGDTATANNTQA